MSIFSELLPKLKEISNAFTKNFNEDLKESLECFDKFEEEFQNGRNRTRDKALKDKSILTTLQSINEDDVDSTTPEDKPKCKSSIKANNANAEIVTQNNNTRRASRKRSKDEVDDMLSPEQEKRQKRNASVKAQSIISKQETIPNNLLTESNIIDVTPKRLVNVNLMQKMRRDDSSEKNQSRTKRREKEDEKENDMPRVQIKQEKVSLPPEPMDEDTLPVNLEVKQEPDRDEIAMPPPSLPVPKPRRAVHKDKSEETTEEDTGKRRNTRTRKPKDADIDTSIQVAPVASARSTRASSRATRNIEPEIPQEPRPKRTRGRKKVSESSVDTDKDSQGTQDSGIGSPAQKSRPKRTKRGQKGADKEVENVQSPKETGTISPKEEVISQPTSPILPNKTKANMKSTSKLQDNSIGKGKMDYNVNVISDNIDGKIVSEESVRENDPEQINKPVLNTTVTLNTDLDRTVVLPNGVYNHAPVTPKHVRNMNETMVIDKFNRETITLDKKNLAMDATVVLERLPQVANVTDDNSLLTDDDDAVVQSTPQKQLPNNQPGSAVKEKVQQFEQLASRVTRTKTRAMTKKDEPAENHTPPDKMSKPAISVDTLSKMNSMIFNGKAPQISSSASKPKSNIPTMTKHAPASTSKLSGINKAKEAAEEFKKEKEDARRKKEALLEAKREMQRKKREEKMAAAAAARVAAERERQAAMEAAAKERMEKQAHADQGKIERQKETERRRQEMARKAAETEERRRAEEKARALRLAEEMRRAEDLRKKQAHEAEAMKKEAAIMAREIEKKQREYIEKQKMKLKMDGGTPLKGLCPAPAPQPVYMADGFQYLNSDSDEEESALPVPAWSTYKGRRSALAACARLPWACVERVFSVRAHSPDLRAIFPNIERARLKRTSSAVWRTPPQSAQRCKP